MTAADVFVVDDNPNNLDLLVGILREHGYGVRMANDGRRALAVVRSHRPELILLDIKMADMDGYEVCRELKVDPATRDIPVIFISALDDVFDKVKGFNTGGVDYITKPFQAEEVVARVENQLQISRLRRELEARERDLEQRNVELLTKNEELLRSRELKAAREEYSRRFIEFQEHDRKRIASELHDSLSQSIVIIKNRALHGLEDRADAANALEQLEEISEAATQALDEVRQIAYDLRPFQIDRLGLTAAIEALVRKTCGASGLRSTTELDDVDGLVPPKREIDLYRIVQESLNNIVRHATATEASVTIRRVGREIEMTIRDNGKGFAPSATRSDVGVGGFGLLGMAERARILGATLDVESALGQGTSVRVHVRPERGD